VIGKAASTMPCHHALAGPLRAYIKAAGIAEHRKCWLFRIGEGTTAALFPIRPWPSRTPGA